MKKTTSRREFLNKGTQLFLACGAIGMCPNLNAMSSFTGNDDVPDPKKLEYCGYSCPPDCPLYIATLENDTEKKKETYKDWKIKEKYNIEFDPEQMFCYKCKSEGKPAGVVVQNGPVRKCVIEKEHECCIECDELTECKKELWQTYPDFHKAIIDMQKKYREATI